MKYFKLIALAGISAAILAACNNSETSSSQSALRSVMWVGNNWAGTATIVDPETLKVLKTGIDLVPDKAEELAAIQTNPEHLAFYLVIQQGPGEGHDQYVDDMFTTLDGRYLAVSRPSFADVVWIDIDKVTRGLPDPIVVEQPMDGRRTDHMGLSPDGRRLLVSDSTARQVIEYSMVDETLPDGTKIKMGDRLRSFPSGETPHENNYSKDGHRVYHASIGRVYTPGDSSTIGPVPLTPVTDVAKGDRWFQIVNNDTFDISHRWDMGKELAETNHPDMSSAVRPMAVTSDEKFIYFQVSFFHGLVEFSTQAADTNGKEDYVNEGEPEPRVGAVTRVIPLPNLIPNVPREQYVNDSAHHGLSISGDDSTLCVAGTMDDYAALVDRKTMEFQLFNTETTGHHYGKPYWTTEGPNNTCWVSLSESDSVAVLDSHSKKELAFLPVGDHPQRIRHGYIPEATISAWSAK